MGKKGRRVVKESRRLFFPKHDGPGCQARGARVGGAPCAVVERQDLLRISLQNFLIFFP